MDTGKLFQTSGPDTAKDLDANVFLFTDGTTSVLASVLIDRIF